MNYLLNPFTSNTMRNPVKVWQAVLPRYLGAILLLFVSLLAAAQTPTITNFSPNSGPAGTVVTINGTNFTGATAVSFGTGASPAASYTVVNSTTITAVVPVSAVTGRLRVTVNGITANSANQFTVTASTPSITFFSPTTGPAGTTVTIHGQNLAGATAVRLGFTNTGFTQISDSIIQFTVPGNANTGIIAVTNPNGTATTTAQFVVTAATNPPTFNRFTPTSGSVGSTVIIHGNYLTTTTAVQFTGNGGGPGGGNVNATYTVVNDSTLSVTVPTNARTGTVTIVTSNGTVTTTAQFTITAASNLPTITIFTPTSGQSGTTVTITGTNFTGATAVSFGGTAATTITVVSSTSITAVVASGTTGSVSVTTPGGTATLAGFIYNPCSNPSNGGTIAAAQTICTGFVPAAFTSSVLPSGHTGTLEYKWQSSTTSSSANFTDIASSNSATYAPGILTATTWYKRLARVGCMANWTGAAESNVLEVTVNQPSFVGTVYHVSNLQATGENIKWYATATGGTALPVTDVLANGHYYASQTTAGGCESTDRFDVTVAVDPTPCAPTAVSPQTPGAGSTVASLITLTGQNIRWYTSALGETALLPSAVWFRESIMPARR